MKRWTFTVVALLGLVGCGTDVETDSAADDAMLQAAMNDSPFMTPGRTPEFMEAAAADLADDARVIGVVVEDQARAYPVITMSGMTSHVVNDVIEGHPVTVTYCDQTDCTRVLTSPEAQSALTVGTGGFVNGEMQITVDGNMYAQSSAEIPLQDLEFTSTNWKDWHQQHPETLVFVIDQQASGVESTAASAGPEADGPDDSEVSKSDSGTP